MVKLYFYELNIEFLEASHLFNQTFFKKIDDDTNADFLFISVTNQTPFFNRLASNKELSLKKIILYNLTEPISFSSAKQFLFKCTKLGIDSKNILFHSTNHFLDQFNCLHKGLSITDHIVKSHIDTNFIQVDQRFLKFIFINNTIRTPRAMVLNELLSRNLNFNQCYVSCNGDVHYGDRHIQNYLNIKNNLNILQSHDHIDVAHHISVEFDKKFQPVYKSCFFNFVIETFSGFAMDNSGFNSHLTEKTIRNFSYKTPFLLLISSEHQIKIIEDLGFMTYNDLFDFKINLNDLDNTIKEYVNIIDTFSRMKSLDIKNLILKNEFKERIEHNFQKINYYRNLDIENIYRYILSDEYENKNEKLLEMNEPNEFTVFSIIGSNI